MGKIVSEETRQKMIKAKLGKKLSEETKEKISNAWLIKRNADERQTTRVKSRRSDETRKKISEAVKRRRGKGIKDEVTGKISYPNC